jgi:long-chain acyl-CoA synthetase
VNALSPLQALYRNAEEIPERTALIAGAANWSYRRLAAGVDRLARAMTARGVRTGDRVVLHMPNYVEMVIAYFACFRIGALPTPLNTRLRTLEIEMMLERLKPALYIGEASLYARIAAFGPEVLPFSARYVVGEVLESAGAQSWEALFRSNRATPLPEFPATSEPAVLLTTWGTTGLPKFVVHTHATLAATVDASVRLGFENHPDPVIMACSPMVHASGFHSLIYGIRFGAPIVLVERFEPDVVLDAIEAHRCSWLAGMPFMFMELLSSQTSRARNVSSMRICLTGGEVCPLDLQYEFPRVFGISLLSFWASTEIVGSMLPGAQPGAVCRVAPGAEVRLIDDSGHPVARGEVGELSLCGPNLTVGYWTQSGVIEPATVDGWYRTGDLMRQGEEDEFWFVGRKRDLPVRPKQTHPGLTRPGLSSLQ